MNDVAQYLADYYFGHAKGIQPAFNPTYENIVSMVESVKDKMIVLRKDGEIRGVAMFLTLTDETYNVIESIDMSSPENMISLVQENGDNIHFVLCTARSLRTILEGIRHIRSARNVKTISWWNPYMTKLHKYSLN